MSIKDKQKKLYNYVKFFNIEKQKKEFPNYILRLSWEGDNKEITDILDQTLKLTLINLKNSIFFELDNHYQRSKDKIINANLSRLNFLSEQSLIAKELQISVGKGNFVNLNSKKSSGTDQINISTANDNIIDSAYYLRGYKAIDMEINFLKNRKYLELENIEKEIESLKKKDIKWINYNIHLLNTEVTNGNKTVNPFISAAIGLLIGILYILILNKFQFYRVSKKK